ncbi:MAG TPA: hypothetical protein PKE58_00560 [Acidobacteriota bacterium]|nr:hypothetical protein [Acidobacteriota bacterium]
MTIRRKPLKQKDESKVSVDEAKINAVINKGGSAPKQSNEEQKIVQALLRLKPALLERVEAAAAARPVYTSRHSWMVEALLEKLKREGF